MVYLQFSPFRSSALKMAEQSVLNFNAPKTDGQQAPGLRAMYDQHMVIVQRGGVREVRDSVDGKKGFVVTNVDPSKNKTVSGATRLIATVFGSEDMNAILKQTRSSRKRSASSAQQGTLVHRHVHHMVECSAGCKCDVQTRGENKFAKRALMFMRGKGWIPLYSELAVYTPEFDIATRVDILCADAEENLVLVSLKTGYHGIEYEKNRFRFKPPFGNLWDTQRNRHQMQLLLEQTMLEHTYQMEIVEQGVLYVNSDPTGANMAIFRTPRQLHINVADTKDKLWNALCERADWGKSAERSHAQIRSRYWSSASTSTPQLGDSGSFGGPTEHSLDGMIIDGT